MERQQSIPRCATTTLTRLWQSQDVVDAVAGFLPTKSLAVLPTLAQSFERDKWRMLGALMRRKRHTAAACTSALFSTLQAQGHDAGHLRERWTDEDTTRAWTPWCKRSGYADLSDENVDWNWTRPFLRNETERFLVMNRMTELDGVCVGMFRQNITGDADRCCVRRFSVSLMFSDGGRIPSIGVGFSLRSTSDANAGADLLSLYIVRKERGIFDLNWSSDRGTHILKSVALPVGARHIFDIDAELDWRTGAATVLVDGVRYDRPCEFISLPFSNISICVSDVGQHAVGPIDVWYYNTPPRHTTHCVHFDKDPPLLRDVSGKVHYLEGCPPGF